MGKMEDIVTILQYLHQLKRFNLPIRHIRPAAYLEQVLVCRSVVGLAEGEARHNRGRAADSPAAFGVSWHIDGKLVQAGGTLRTPAGPHSLSSP